MPRALWSRGQKNLPPKCYSILTSPLLDSHHGVTRYPRATCLRCVVDAAEANKGQDGPEDTPAGLGGDVGLVAGHGEVS